MSEAALRAAVAVASRRALRPIWFAVMAGVRPGFAERAAGLVAFYRERA